MASDYLSLSAPAETAIIRLRCWSDFAITDALTGADLRVRGRKARALLAYLALHAGKAVSRERLAGLLWGERGEEQARLSLRQTIFELKQFKGVDRPVLRVERDTVMLQPCAVATDIDWLSGLADKGDYDALLAVLPDPTEALLANLDGIDPEFDDWLAIERARQTARLISLIGDASASALMAGKVRQARALHARLVEFGSDDPRIAGAAVPYPSVDPMLFAPPGIGPDRGKPASLALAAVVALLLAVVGLAGAGAFQTPGIGPSSFDGAKSDEAANLQRTARGLIYKRDPSSLRVAAELLHQAVVIDPDFAPAYSSLASVTVMLSTDGSGMAEAERYARRALALRPDLAQSHATLGMVLNFQGPEAGLHLKRAAEIDPNDAEVQFWLSNYYSTRLEYKNRLKALRRAVAIDPQWPRAVNQAALAAWEMGYPDEANRYVRRLAATYPEFALACDYELDVAQGSFAKTVKTILANRRSRQKSNETDEKLGLALVTLGHLAPARLLLRLPDEDWAVIDGRTPTFDQARRIFSRRDRDQLEATLMLTVRRKLLDAGRAAELIRLYAGSDELSDNIDNRSILETAPDMALAFRAVGRSDEADALLGRADIVARRAIAVGKNPNWFYADLAQLRAAQGRTDEAIRALRTAIDRGWHYWPMTTNPDIGAIASFRSLRGNARFEQLRARLLKNLNRERRALGPITV